MNAVVTPQSLVDQAVAASTADDCIAIVRDTTSANLRWANNTLTTNGVMHAVTVTVVSFYPARRRHLDRLRDGQRQHVRR